jgi:hypothetical protein
VTHRGRSTWCTRRRSAELFHRYSIYSLSVAEVRLLCRYLKFRPCSSVSLASSTYFHVRKFALFMILYHSSFVAAPDVVSYFPLPFLAVLGSFWIYFFLVRFRVLALPFLDGFLFSDSVAPSPSNGRSRAVRSSLGIRYLRSFVPGVLFPAFPPRLGRRVLLHPCRGNAGYLLWDLPPPYEHHHDFAFAPSSPTDLPYTRPALIVAARLDLPIRALLLRVLASHVCSAPRARMRSARRRTGTRTPVPRSDSCISWARRWAWRWMRGVRARRGGGYGAGVGRMWKCGRMSVKVLVRVMRTWQVEVAMEM